MGSSSFSQRCGREYFGAVIALFSFHLTLVRGASLILAGNIQPVPLGIPFRATPG